MSKTAPVALSCLLLGGFVGTQLGAARAAEPAAQDSETSGQAAEVEQGDAEPLRIRPAVEELAALPSNFSRFDKLDRFARALALLEQYYVRPVDGEALIDAALTGLAAELDPHTIYLPPDEAKMLLEDTEGRFGGVGLVVTLRAEPIPAPDSDSDSPDEAPAEASEAGADRAKASTDDAGDEPADGAGDGAGDDEGPMRLVMHIDDVVPGGPAAQAGIVVGDRILAIEGKPIANFSDLGDAVAIMRGEPGTIVSFTLLHEEQPARELSVTRAIVAPPAVELRWLGEGLGSLRLRDFQASSSREIRAGLDELRARAKQEGGKLEGVVLDLRDNGGGLLDQAIAVVDTFVSEGVIVRTRGRQAQLLDEARAHAINTERKLPLVVLMNKGSASASEIVAGALQDHRRALIIGERSYGKGSVQAPFDLGGGALLKLTTALYYTPADRLIQASGIEPDVMVGPLRAEYADSRPELRPERDSPQHLEPQDFGRPPVPEEEAALSPARVEAGEDAQLLAAIDHLQAWARVAR